MNRRVLIFALIVSGIISWFLWTQIQKKQQAGTDGDAGTRHAPVPPAPPPAPIAKWDVVVAKKVIPARTRFEKETVGEYLGIEARVASSVPDDAFLADKGGIASLTGKYLAFSVLASDVITLRHLLSSGDAVPALAYAIEPGKRAITISVDTTTQAVGGFVQQGDYVDVIAIFGRSAERPDAMAKTVLQDIKVLAVGNVYQFDQSIASTPPALAAGKVEKVTLAVSPDEMERLIYLSSQVQFRIALKNPDDVGATKQFKSLGANERTVLSPQGGAAASGDAPTSTVVAAPVVSAVSQGPSQMPVIEVFYGPRRTEVRMDDPLRSLGGQAAAKAPSTKSTVEGSTERSARTAPPAEQGGE